MCDYRLILIAERDTVYEKFPTPLINRLEKHFVLTSSVLKDWQLEVLEDFNEWIKGFSRIRCHLNNLKLIKPRRMCKGYSSSFVRVTTLVAAYLVYMSKVGWHIVSCRFLKI